MPEEIKDQAGSESKEQPTETAAGKVFTQVELNSILKKEKESYNSKMQQVLKNMETFKQTAELSQKDKEELEKQLEEFKTRNLTELELTKQELAKIKKEKDAELNRLNQEATTWKKRFNESVINTEIVKAATENEAFSAEQILALLSGKTQLAEDIGEDGKPNGRFIVRTAVEAVDEKGNHITLSLSPTDALKKMKEDTEKYGNLFKSTARTGLGSNASANMKKPTNFKGMSYQEIKAYLDMTKKK